MDHYYTTLSSTLLHAQSVSPVLPDKEMFETAECWAIESGGHGVVGHDRITCEGGYWGENCSYGLSTGFAIIMQLLIDYGIESLGQRKNMLSPRWRGLGTSIRVHTGYGMCAVQNFTN